MAITIRWIPATNSYSSGENRGLRAGGIILSNYLREFTSLCPASYYKQWRCFHMAVWDGNALVPWQASRMTVVSGNGMFWQHIDDSAFSQKTWKSMLYYSLYSLFIVEFISLISITHRVLKQLVYKLKFNFIWGKNPHKYYTIEMCNAGLTIKIEGKVLNWC